MSQSLMGLPHDKRGFHLEVADSGSRVKVQAREGRGGSPWETEIFNLAGVGGGGGVIGNKVLCQCQNGCL